MQIRLKNDSRNCNDLITENIKYKKRLVLQTISTGLSLEEKKNLSLQVSHPSTGVRRGYREGEDSVKGINVYLCYRLFKNSTILQTAYIHRISYSSNYVTIPVAHDFFIFY